MKKKKFFSRFIATILTIVLIATGLWWGLPPAHASDADGLAAQISAIGELTAEVAVNEVTVKGYANVGSAGLTLNIDSGVTVIWEAYFEGAATANNYLLTLSGDGTFVLDGGSLSNTKGAGGTVYINGGVRLDVINYGLIDSPGSGSAVTVARNVQNAKINVFDYGKIRSTPNGYAINDGGGFDNGTNNTEITVGLYGLIEAGTACAIRSTGSDSVVIVSGGTVQNAASNNLNPAINMNCAPPPADSTHYNVIITSDGTVRAMNSNGYAIQSSQNVRVESGTVSAIGGRAISLVGMKSVARIEGGRVSTVTGDAICTSTTTRSEIVNARIEVAGGVVEAIGSGNALRITGSNNTVLITGGQVLAKNGRAVYAAEDVPTSTDRITIEGGFVFAWGGATGIEGGNNVIAPGGKYTYTGGVIVAWNTSTGIGEEQYNQGDDLHLRTIPENTVLNEIHWDKNPDTSVYLDGIRYGSAPEDFFQLNVEVLQNVFELTLITTVDGVPEGEPIIIKAVEGSAVSLEARGENPILPVEPPDDYPTNGDKFIKWVADVVVVFGDENAGNTYLIMPGSPVTVTAEFSLRHLLHVDGLGGAIAEGQRNYSGSSANYGYYAEYEIVLISASYQYNSRYFTNWSSVAILPGIDPGAIASSVSLVTTFTMPANAAHITANSAAGTLPDQTSYKTTVDKGKIANTTGGTATFTSLECTALAGTGLIIEAIEPYPNAIFTGWTSSNGGGFTDASSPNTVFVMPNDNTTITATFDHGYTLTVNEGSGTGVYKAGDKVHIAANNAPTGKRFTKWTENGGAPFTGDDLSSTMFIMPAANTEITADYTDIQYTLEVINGVDETGAATYSSGDYVAIKADPVSGGIQFEGWIVASGSGRFEYDYLMDAYYFIMSNDNAIIIATYSEAQVSPNPPFFDPGMPGSRGGGSTRNPDTKLADGDVSQLLDTSDHIAYVRGVGGGLFAPDNNMSRAEVAQMFYNLLIDKNIQITKTFPDVPENAWFKVAVDTLASLGVIAGRPDGKFYPGDAITRAEFVSIAVRFTEQKPLDGQYTSFADVPESHWAYENIAAAMSYGWVYGVGEGNFEPNRRITRAEAVTMTNRMLIRLPDEAYIDGHADLVSYSDVLKAHWAFYDIMEASNAHDFTRNEDGSESWQLIQ